MRYLVLISLLGLFGCGLDDKTEPEVFSETYRLPSADDADIDGDRIALASSGRARVFEFERGDWSQTVNIQFESDFALAGDFFYTTRSLVQSPADPWEIYDGNCGENSELTMYSAVSGEKIASRVHLDGAQGVEQFGGRVYASDGNALLSFEPGELEETRVGPPGVAFGSDIRANQYGLVLESVCPVSGPLEYLDFYDGESFSSRRRTGGTAGPGGFAYIQDDGVLVGDRLVPYIDGRIVDIRYVGEQLYMLANVDHRAVLNVLGNDAFIQVESEESPPSWHSLDDSDGWLVFRTTDSTVVLRK